MIDVWNWVAAIPSWHSPAEWSAIAAMGTLAVAIAAAVFALFQVNQLKGSRRDQTRPYVAVSFETDGHILDFVVKNFGTTSARNVRLTLDKPVLRSFKKGDDFEALKIFDVLPTMVPGQEWRTFYDTGIGLSADPSLRSTYTVTATYQDSRGRPLPTDIFVLDWSTFLDIEFTGSKDVDDLAKAAEGIQATLASWTEGIRGLAVYTRDGDAKDAARRADLIRRGRIPPDPARGETAPDAQ